MLRRTAISMGPLLLALLASVACGDDVETREAAGGAGGSGGGVGLGGHCASDIAASECAGDCAFEAADIDCAAACANLATVCSDSECMVACDPQLSDMALCVMSCDGTKTQHCSNLSWGCFGRYDSCENAGLCFNDNKTAGL